MLMSNILRVHIVNWVLNTQFHWIYIVKWYKVTAEHSISISFIGPSWQSQIGESAVRQSKLNAQSQSLHSCCPMQFTWQVHHLGHVGAQSQFLQLTLHCRLGSQWRVQSLVASTATPLSVLQIPCQGAEINNFSPYRESKDSLAAQACSFTLQNPAVPTI